MSATVYADVGRQRRDCSIERRVMAMKKNNSGLDSLPDIEEQVLGSLIEDKDSSQFAKRQLAKRLKKIQKKKQKKSESSK